MGERPPIIIITVYMGTRVSDGLTNKQVYKTHAYYHIHTHLNLLRNIVFCKDAAQLACCTRSAIVHQPSSVTSLTFIHTIVLSVDLVTSRRHPPPPPTMNKPLCLLLHLYLPAAVIHVDCCLYCIFPPDSTRTRPGSVVIYSPSKKRSIAGPGSVALNAVRSSVAPRTFATASASDRNC